MLSSVILSLLKKQNQNNSRDIALIQSIGSVGGVIATGIGFSLPMLYFLDKQAFIHFTASPLLFCITLSTTTFIAGSLGIYLGHSFSPIFISSKNLPYPVSTLTHTIITSRTKTKDGKSVLWGLWATSIICFFRDYVSIIPQKLYILPSIFSKHIAFSIWPTLWALGYTIGFTVTIPLFIGLLSKYFILAPLNNHSLYLPFELFLPQDMLRFSIAFCCGLVLSEIIMGTIKNLKKSIQAVII